MSVVDRKCQWGQIGSADLELILLLLQALAHLFLLLSSLCLVKQMLGSVSTMLGDEAKQHCETYLLLQLARVLFAGDDVFLEPRSLPQAYRVSSKVTCHPPLGRQAQPSDRSASCSMSS
jgi:hypothetical protein